MTSDLMPSLIKDNQPVVKGDLRQLFVTIEDELNHGGFYGFTPANLAPADATVKAFLEALDAEIPNFGAGGGVTSFTALDDTPADFSGSSLFLLRVNSGLTAVEFVDPATLAFTLSQITDAGSFAALSAVPDDHVTLAMLAHGTPDKFIGFDASGVPVEKDEPTGTGGDNFDFEADGTDYSVTAFEVATNGAAANEHRRFLDLTGSNIINFPSGISDDSYGAFSLGAGAAAEIRCPVGVSVNGLDDRGGANPVITVFGYFSWEQTGLDTIEVNGALSLPTTVYGEVTFNDILKLDSIMNAQNHRILRYRSQKYSNAGNVNVNDTNFDPGSTIIHTGGASTYTLESILAAAETDQTVSYVIHNRGSGAVAVAASGVSIKGNTSIAVDESATLEYEHDGTTEFVWVRATA